MQEMTSQTEQATQRLRSRALTICGIAGYKAGKFSVGRHLRGEHSASLMIANDRILAANVSMLLVHKGA